MNIHASEARPGLAVATIPVWIGAARRRLGDPTRHDIMTRGEGSRVDINTTEPEGAWLGSRTETGTRDRRRLRHHSQATRRTLNRRGPYTAPTPSRPEVGKSHFGERVSALMGLVEPRGTVYRPRSAPPGARQGYSQCAYPFTPPEEPGRPFLCSPISGSKGSLESKRRRIRFL
jgi:hypothetical protein